METTTEPTGYFEISRQLNGGGWHIIDTRTLRSEADLAVATDYRQQNPAQMPRYRISGEDVRPCPALPEDRSVGIVSDERRVICRMCDTSWPFADLDLTELPPHLAPEGRRPTINTSHNPASCDTCAKAVVQARGLARVTGSRGASCSYTTWPNGGDQEEHHATWSTGPSPA